MFFKIFCLEEFFLYSYQIEVKSNWISEIAAMVQGKCTKRSAQIASKNVKFLSFLKRGDRSIVENAIQNIDNISHCGTVTLTFSPFFVLYFILRF